MQSYRQHVNKAQGRDDNLKDKKCGKILTSAYSPLKKLRTETRHIRSYMIAINRMELVSFVSNKINL
uniref:Uncharacterized protein n=1 Tax=Glossina palpalis gambiensis TaxID=67801 RepID=A0A1B0BBP1_9MUSC